MAFDVTGEILCRSSQIDNSENELVFPIKLWLNYNNKEKCSIKQKLIVATKLVPGLIEKDLAILKNG